MLLLPLIGQSKKRFNPVVSKLLGNNILPSPPLLSALLLCNLVRNRTWGEEWFQGVTLHIYTHIKYKIKYVQFLSFNTHDLNVSLQASLHLKTQLLPYSKDI